MKNAGIAGMGLLLASCTTAQTNPQPVVFAQDASGNPLKDELGDSANTFDEITHFNNYYEFSFAKESVAKEAQSYHTSPWKIEVSGLVNKPKVFDMEEILKKFSPEERIYRMRCVEGWSMVIPWSGFPLAKLIKEVEPASSAKYVSFTSAYLPDDMPGVHDSFFSWPYTEGLRLDEALNDLTLLATGIYGKPLPNQDGAPVRLVVPWKYGFKSAKTLVKIELTADQPKTFWNTSAPNEYGFYSNVNPDVPHPRWSQSSERRIGETGRRKTLMFNGYADQVANLYSGMDLATSF